MLGFAALTPTYGYGPLRALLFDVDGTLAETERDGHRIAFNRAFRDCGLRWDWDAKRYGELLQITGGRERIAHYAALHDPRWLAGDDAASAIAELHARKNLHYADLVRRGRIQLRHGLHEWLQQARTAGLHLGIVTTTSRDNLEALLDSSFDADMRAAFGVRITGEDVRLKKPDPECYRLALAALGLQPSQALAIEDSRNGLRSAMAAEVPTLIVRSHYFRDDDFSGAWRVIDDFRECSLADVQRRFDATQLDETACPHRAVPIL
ncbi:HAD-IA family hydrolase [Hydrocarboniphaga sp.]|uniref:HAD-IA family hydrolase n=1 Tax=Hydrocarboniphaga sp. TaxID=2033016 RepID=UPI002637B3C8|nr:HAD-IA family hydrolase [Hydrocarboniphaga sp.]